jgi:hypothetical protein
MTAFWTSGAQFSSSSRLSSSRSFQPSWLAVFSLSPALNRSRSAAPLASSMALGLSRPLFSMMPSARASASLRSSMVTGMS